MARKFVLIIFLAILLAPIAAFADDDDNDHRLQAVPSNFVGAAGDCGTDYPAGSNIVTSAWLGGMGLPDNGDANFNDATPSNPPSKKDPHLGLLLNKNGASPICSAAGAEIKGVKRMEVTAGFHLGFDYRNGTHCGAGAGRFNVSYRQPDNIDGFSFVGGCSNDPSPQPAPQDPSQWTRVRFDTSNAGQSFPVIPVGSRITSISVILDEGTDTPTNDTEGVGLTVIDNIDINGRLITRGSGIEPPPSDKDSRRKEKDDD